MSQFGLVAGVLKSQPSTEQLIGVGGAIFVRNVCRKCSQKLNLDCFTSRQRASTRLSVDTPERKDIIFLVYDTDALEHNVITTKDTIAHKHNDNHIGVLAIQVRH